MSISLERLVQVARPLIVIYSSRRWNSQFGLSLERVQKLHSLLQMAPRNLLWMLWFLKVYPTEGQASGIFSPVSEKTFRARVRSALTLCKELLPKVSLKTDHQLHLCYLHVKRLKFSDRWIDWDMVCPSCVADGCDFAIQEPSHQPQRVRKRFFAKKTFSPVPVCHTRGVRKVPDKLSKIFVFAVRTRDG